MTIKIFLFSFLYIFSINAQIENIIKDLSEKKNNSISEKEAYNGLKEALTIGVTKSCENASNIDGFLKNDLIKIKFPQEAKKIKKSLKKIGLEKQIDEFIVSMNRSAEEASKEASQILLKSIKNININNALSILYGEENSATTYLYDQNHEDFRNKFKPIIEKSISNNKVAANWNKIMKTYNKLPLTENINPNINEYILEKTIDGIFVLIAQEEKKIREKPENRISELLKKVFNF